MTDMDTEKKLLMLWTGISKGWENSNFCGVHSFRNNPAMYCINQVIPVFLVCLLITISSNHFNFRCSRLVDLCQLHCPFKKIIWSLQTGEVGSSIFFCRGCLVCLSQATGHHRHGSSCSAFFCLLEQGTPWKPGGGFKYFFKPLFREDSHFD